MQRTFGISYNEGGEKDPLYIFRRYRAAGFSELELSFGTASPRAVVEAASGAGLRVRTARLPSDGANLLWDSKQVWNNLHAFYKTYFSLAASHGIESLIFSPSVGRTPPAVTQWGLERLIILAEDAEKAGVRLLFENDVGKNHFDAAVRACCHGYHGVSYRLHSAMDVFGTAVPPAYATPHIRRVVLEEDKENYARPLFGRTDLVRAAQDLLTEAKVDSLVVRQDMPENLFSHEAFAAAAYDIAYRFEQILRNAEARL